MFYSDYNAKLNAKGQLILPAKYRDVIYRDELAQGKYGPNEPEERPGSTLFLIQVDDRCLYIYMERILNEWVDKLLAEEALKRSPDFRRKFFRRVTPVDYDANGRFVLPADRRAQAGIDRDCVFSGNGDRIELWAADRMEALDTQQEEQGIDEELQDFIGVRLEGRRG